MTSKNSSYLKSKTDSYTILTYLALVGIAVLFLGLSAAYLLSRDDWTWGEFRFPKLFLLSTILLLVSSFSFNYSKRALIADKSEQFKRSSIIGLVLGIGFLVSQIGGWISLHNQGIFLAGTPDGSFLYIISAVHAVHIAVGLLILGILVIRFIIHFNSPVSRLLLTTDEDRIRYYKLAILYWHFVDFLWIYLLFFLLFNHL